MQRQLLQTSKGPLSGASFALSGDCSLSGYRSASAALLGHGQLPDDCVGFAFTDSLSTLQLSGNAFSRDSIAMVDRGEHYHAVYPGNYRLYYLILNEQKIRSILADEEIDAFHKVKTLLKNNKLSHAKVSQAMIDCVLNFSVQPAVQSSELASRDYEHAITQNLLQLTQNYELSTLRLNRRSRIVQKAIEYMLDSDLSAISLGTVAQTINASQRSIELAFKKHLHITPKEFLTNVRLNAIRRELKTGNDNVKLRNIARIHGVTQMDNFAKAYYQLFGESPLETLHSSNRT